jgi:hypothetical protein
MLAPAKFGDLKLTLPGNDAYPEAQVRQCAEDETG